MDNTDVTVDVVAMIYGCRKLCRLRLNKTSVTSGGVSDFVTRNGIADLEELSLGSTTTDDGVCRILPSLHQLRIIDLFGTHVTDKTAHVISILRNVEVLSVSKSLITADGVGQFPRMPGLKKLYVSGIRTLSDIAMFSTMDSLEYLDVAYTSVDDRGVGALPRFACLRSLVLDGCEISDESIPLFLETTHLVSLSLRETRMSRLGVAQMKSERPAMKCWNDWVP